MSELLEELAVRRLLDDIDGGLQLSHEYILKMNPGKKWGDKYGGFSWCINCEQWAWATDFHCPIKYQEAKENYLKALTEEDKLG